MKWWIGALLLFLAGLALHLGLLVFAMYAFLGVLLFSRVLTRAWTLELDVTRTVGPPMLEIGDSMEIEITLDNRGPWRVPWLLVEDCLPADATKQQPQRLVLSQYPLQLVQVPARGQYRLRYEVQFQQRGYFQLGPVLLESGDLFGLHRRYRIATQPQFVTVLPKVVPLEGYNVASRRPIGEVRMTHRLFEDPTRMAGVRAYQMGDPLNRIHWPATARTGTFQCKTYEPSCVAGATLVLDFHQWSFVGVPDYAMELAVTTAASLAHALYLLGQQVGLVTNGRDAAERIRTEGQGLEFRTRKVAQSQLGLQGRSERLEPVCLPARRGIQQFQDILEALARLETTDGFSVGQMIPQTSHRMPRDASVIAILCEVTEETAISLGNLRRSGYAVTAIIIVPPQDQYFDWAVPPEWAGRLLAEHIDLRQVEDEAALSRLCAEQFTH
jgi:uncharacterized protein (DUF58 family)